MHCACMVSVIIFFFFNFEKCNPEVLSGYIGKTYPQIMLNDVSLYFHRQ